MVGLCGQVGLGRKGYREGRRWRWHTSWRWPLRASCPQSLRHLWRTLPLRPCWRGSWTPAASAWCSHRWQSGWPSRRCRHTRPTCPGRNRADRPSGTPAARTRKHSFAVHPGFCHHAESHYQWTTNAWFTQSVPFHGWQTHLVSSCRRVLISQMGLVAVMAVNPGKFRRTEVQTDAETFRRTQSNQLHSILYIVQWQRQSI